MLLKYLQVLLFAFRYIQKIATLTIRASGMVTFHVSASRQCHVSKPIPSFTHLSTPYLLIFLYHTIFILNIYIYIFFSHISHLFSLSLTSLSLLTLAASPCRASSYFSHPAWRGMVLVAVPHHHISIPHQSFTPLPMLLLHSFGCV